MNAHDHIDDYMAGLLSGEDLIEFEAAVASDEQLRRLVENYDEIKSVSEGVLELQLLNEVTAIQPDNKTIKQPRSNNRYFLLAAAFLLLAAVAYYFFSEKNKIQEEPVLFADVYREPIWPVTKSVAPERDDKHYIAKASATYLAGDLTSAKIILLDSVQDAELGHYWLAEMYMAEQAFDSVLVYLPEASVLEHKSNRIKTMNKWLQQLSTNKK